jgi:hypothetical protein
MANSDNTVDIRLANGKGVAVIDADDAARIPLTGWYRHPLGYAARHMRAKTDGENKAHMLLHRLIMRAPSGADVDHINHDKLDCRRCNLRLVTKSQNMQNRKGGTGRLGVRGVTPYQTKNGTRFCAQAQVNGKHMSAHGFTTVEAAAEAARELRRRHFTHSAECGQ